jgi:hypothetical protein
VYEIDNQPALALYKSYLGDYAAELPGSALLYPLSMRLKGEDQPVTRTILSIDEENQSLTFAANMPEGSLCQLMHSNTEELVDAAETSAQNALQLANDPEFAFVVSCVGRRIVMSTRVNEEIDCIRNVLPENCVMTGFYSHGEIAPIPELERCGIHNQTIAVTLMGERC